jgi:ActR/RegA family two-component response regulator
MKLLLVDDERAILVPLARYLRARGLEVSVAEDAESAEALLAREPFDVIVADLHLSPGRPAEGLELLERAGARHPRMRRVLLTAYGSPEVERKAAALGVDRVLGKPQPLATLFGVIAELGDRGDSG